MLHRQKSKVIMSTDFGIRLPGFKSKLLLNSYVTLNKIVNRTILSFLNYKIVIIMIQLIRML